ncbi:uncharacterized protein LOC106177912 [Lingula anatina]|uniref:Uncharacterized protein LOC106177912 n=1 Tax=Lingula anatina TaxID=7574 RepID=A0A1S3K106_LINAN|nr:uncharacterized protein LOC106177912 [Lingula anatina]|eukprot:XP_013416310.1 uncharacterized protein LOC106177912 [Lingula anatina]
MMIESLNHHPGIRTHCAISKNKNKFKSKLAFKKRVSCTLLCNTSEHFGERCSGRTKVSRRWRRQRFLRRKALANKEVRGLLQLSKGTSQQVRRLVTPNRCLPGDWMRRRSQTSDSCWTSPAPMPRLSRLLKFVL